MSWEPSSLGAPVAWHSAGPKGITKPGFVVHTGHLMNGLGLLPAVGVVRGIFTDAKGQYGIRVRFPCNCGATGTFFPSNVSAQFPQEWFHLGDWNALLTFRRNWLDSLRRAGVEPPPGVWPEGYLPLPAEFYGR